jgi:hypothetical protein
VNEGENGEKASQAVVDEVAVKAGVPATRTENEHQVAEAAHTVEGKGAARAVAIREGEAEAAVGGEVVAAVATRNGDDRMDYHKRFYMTINYKWDISLQLW